MNSGNVATLVATMKFPTNSKKRSNSIDTRKVFVRLSKSVLKYDKLES